MGQIAGSMLLPATRNRTSRPARRQSATISQPIRSSCGCRDPAAWSPVRKTSPPVCKSPQLKSSRRGAPWSRRPARSGMPASCNFFGLSFARLVSGMILFVHISNRSSFFVPLVSRIRRYLLTLCTSGYPASRSRRWMPLLYWPRCQLRFHLSRLGGHRVGGFCAGSQRCSGVERINAPGAGATGPYLPVPGSLMNNQSVGVPVL